MSRPAHRRTGLRRLEKAMLGLAGPLVLQNILFTLMGFVDSLMVGQLGEDIISAVGNAAQVQMFLFLIFTAIGQGGSILATQYHGAGDRESTLRVASTMNGAGLAIGAFLGVLTWFLAPAFIWMLTLGRSPAVVEAGAEYLRIVALGYVFMTPGNMVASSLRSLGDTTTPVKIAVLGNILNVTGNFILIFGLGPIPALGYQGAAISTAISSLVQGTLLLWLAASPRGKLRLPVGQLFRIHRDEFVRIIKIGYPMSIDGVYWQAARVAFTMIFNAMGSSAYAAYTIVRNLKGMALLPSQGLQAATMITVGQSLGRAHFLVARIKARIGLRMSLAIMAVPALAVIAAAGPLTSLYHVTEATFQATVICTMIMGVSIFFTTVNSVLPGILRSGGDTAVVMRITLLSFLFFGGPMAFLFGIVFQWGVVGAFVGVSLEEVIKSVWFWHRYKKGLWLRSLARKAKA